MDETVTVEKQRDLYGAIGEASAYQLRDGKLLKDKVAEPKHQPVVVKMYEELQTRSTALLVEVQTSPEPLNTDLEQVFLLLNNWQQTHTCGRWS